MCLKLGKICSKFSSQSYDLGAKIERNGIAKKNDLAKIMVEQLDLTCTPDQYLEETYKIHMEVFGEVKQY